MSVHDLSDSLTRTITDRSPLEAAEDTFTWLVTDPAPLAVHGGHLPGMPNRRLPLHHLRSRLAGRRLRPAEVDAVWAHLVLRARTAATAAGRGRWTVGCVGIGMPMLARTAAHLSLRYSGDPADVEAAVLAGFLAELHRTDICAPHIGRRLHHAADRAGRTLIDALTLTRPATQPQPPAAEHPAADPPAGRPTAENPAAHHAAAGHAAGGYAAGALAVHPHTHPSVPIPTAPTAPTVCRAGGQHCGGTPAVQPPAADGAYRDSGPVADLTGRSTTATRVANRPPR